MNRREFLSAAAAAGISRSSFAARPRPNILVILADDLGWSDLGCYGSEIRSPYIDSLAETGVRFAHFRSTAGCPSAADSEVAPFRKRHLQDYPRGM